MDQGYDFAKGAERLEKVPVSLIRAIMNRAAELEAEGKPVIRFSAGEPNFNTPSDIKEAAIRAIPNNYTHYASNKGYEPLRVRISKYMEEFSRVHYDPLKEILVTSSAAEALNNAMLATGLYLCRRKIYAFAFPYPSIFHNQRSYLYPGRCGRSHEF